MSISLDNINFCYQPPPPKPYQLPSTPAHIPHRTCLDAPKPGAAVASAPAQHGAPETVHSLGNSRGAAASGPVKAQTNDDDSRKAAVEDVSQEQSDEQASLPIQPATSESRPVATEQKVPDLPSATSLDLPEESMGDSTSSIGDIISASISRSPSMGVLEDTLGPERAPQTERVNIHERAVGDSQSQEARHVARKASDMRALGLKSQAQEVFGRGILRIQPHGPRNAYIITFLPDVVEAAPKSSASELCEESSSSTGRGPTNPTNTSTVDSVPGAQKHLPIDPLILADDGPLESGDLHQPFSLGDDAKPSEAICSYPDPPPLFYSALDQRDSIRPRQGEDTQSTSSPNDRHSVAVGNPPSRDSPTSAHGGRQSKSRKRKPCRLDGRPPKRVLGPHTSAPVGNPFAPLYTYLQSLPLDRRLQLLPWLLDDSPPHYMPTPDLLATGNGDVRPASRLPQRSESCEPHGSSRKGMPYSSEERDLLLKLRRDEKRP
ncbi:hypothetical protein NYO67_8956 [Aspergillus flavus]|nr:hypothetical protein NYO67_8956 [Aspergillus flavus]